MWLSKITAAGQTWTFAQQSFVVCLFYSPAAQGFESPQKYASTAEYDQRKRGERERKKLENNSFLHNKQENKHEKIHNATRIEDKTHKLFLSLCRGWIRAHACSMRFFSSLINTLLFDGEWGDVRRNIFRCSSRSVPLAVRCQRSLCSHLRSALGGQKGSGYG